MSLIQRSAAPPKQAISGWRWLVIVTVGALIFLLDLHFVSMPGIDLDTSWTEVLAWAALRHAHWGRDLVFTYGPLGFLHGSTSYVPGILLPYVIGSTALAAAFVIAMAAMLRKQSIGIVLLFGLVFVASFPWLSSDVSWAMTMLFAMTAMLDRDRSEAGVGAIAILLILALTFAAIALIKFSLFPLWLLCWVVLLGESLLRGSLRRALIILLIFPAALMLEWWCCGQDLGDLPVYLRASIEIATGYSQTMGTGTRALVEIAAFGCAGGFGLLCVLGVWRHRRDGATLLALLLYAGAAFLAWRANFTRADHVHWLFSYFSLLPFVLLAHRLSGRNRLLRFAAMALILISALPGLYEGDAWMTRWSQAWAEANWHFHALLSLADIQRERTEQWQAAQRQYALPAIKQRVGTASIDLVTVAQGAVLLNDLNYTPRPVFQSYSAYTPYLARRNESWLLGPQAAEYILMQLDAIDGRLPTLEDPLSLIVLQQRYRPVMIEQGFLLLQRDPTAATTPALESPAAWHEQALGDEVAVDTEPGRSSIAFIQLDLTVLGQLYSLLVREPPLHMLIRSEDGEQDFRFVRPVAATGFVISPLPRSTRDWASLQLDLPITHVRSLRLLPEAAWQRIFFQPHFQIALQSREYLRETDADTRAALTAVLYPGFNLMPVAIRGNHESMADQGRDRLRLNGTAALTFLPTPGRYRISAEFGVDDNIVTDPACVAADGIGLSLLRVAAGGTTVLLHRELNPLARPDDRGNHRFELDDVRISDGERIEYRTDPGNGGDNTVCDFSHVRELRFDPLPSQ